MVLTYQRNDNDMRPTGAPASEPTLLTVMQHVIANALSTVHTAFPGQIEKYDYTTAKADILPLISATAPDGTILKMPVIPNVPIVWPRTSLGSISFPLQRGDGCLVVCSEKSIDDWLLLGGKNEPKDPRTFDLNDAIAIPGLYPFNVKTKINGNDKFEIHYKEQQITIDNSGNIEIGGAPLQKLMNAAAMAIYNLHTHICAAPGVASAPPLPTMIETTHLTTKVKAQ
jgi:hypothetical protein